MLSLVSFLALAFTLGLLGAMVFVAVRWSLTALLIGPAPGVYRIPTWALYLQQAVPVLSAGFRFALLALIVGKGRTVFRQLWNKRTPPHYAASPRALPPAGDEKYSNFTKQWHLGIGYVWFGLIAAIVASEAVQSLLFLRVDVTGILDRLLTEELVELTFLLIGGSLEGFLFPGLPSANPETLLGTILILILPGIFVAIGYLNLTRVTADSFRYHGKEAIVAFKTQDWLRGAYNLTLFLSPSPIAIWFWITYFTSTSLL